MAKRVLALVTGDQELEQQVRNLCRSFQAAPGVQPLSVLLFLDPSECLDACTRTAPDAPAAVLIDMSTVDLLSSIKTGEEPQGPKGRAGNTEREEGVESVSPSVQFMQKFRALAGHSQTPLLVCDATITAQHLWYASDYNFFRIIEGKGGSGALKAALESLAGELARPAAVRQAFVKLAQAVQDGRAGDAESIVDECFQLHRDDPKVLLECGNYWLRQGQVAKVDKAFARLQSLANPSLRVSSFLARVEMKRGNAPGALQIMERADALSPGNLERLVLMGDAFRVTGQDERANESYSGALAIDSTCRPAQRGLGLVALNQGEVDRALALFGQACTEDETAGFFNNSAILLVKRSQFDQARGLYEAASRALKNPTTMAKVCFNQGLMYRRWGKANEAADRFREALKCDPALEKADRHLALVAAGGGTDARRIPESAEIRDTNVSAFADPLLSEAEKVTHGAAPATHGRVLTMPSGTKETRSFSVGRMIAQAPRQRGETNGTMQQLKNLGEAPEEVTSKPVATPRSQSSMAAPKPRPPSADKVGSFLDDSEEEDLDAGTASPASSRARGGKAG